MYPPCSSTNVVFSVTTMDSSVKDDASLFIVYIPPLLYNVTSENSTGLPVGSRGRVGREVPGLTEGGRVGYRASING